MKILVSVPKSIFPEVSEMEWRQGASDEIAIVTLAEGRALLQPVSVPEALRQGTFWLEANEDKGKDRKSMIITHVVCALDGKPLKVAARPRLLSAGEAAWARFRSAEGLVVFTIKENQVVGYSFRLVLDQDKTIVRLVSERVYGGVIGQSLASTPAFKDAIRAGVAKFQCNQCQHIHFGTLKQAGSVQQAA